MLKQPPIISWHRSIFNVTNLPYPWALRGEGLITSPLSLTLEPSTHGHHLPSNFSNFSNLAKDIVLVSGFGYQFASYGNTFFEICHSFRNVPSPVPHMLCNAPMHYKKIWCITRFCGALQKTGTHNPLTGTRTMSFHGLNRSESEMEPIQTANKAEWRGGSGFFWVFFNIFCLDQGPFCGTTDCSCFGLRVSFLRGFKSRVDISPALFLACVLWSWRSQLVRHLPFPPIGVYTV